jgi:hypothetical protein
MSRFSVTCVLKAVPAPRMPTRWRELIAPFWRTLFDPYRPELYYMRGPGPKWREKYQVQTRHATCP